MVCWFDVSLRYKEKFCNYEKAFDFGSCVADLVMGNLMNAAYALGLGTCWIHRAKEVFDSEDGKALLESWGIKGDYEGIGNCIIGYPAQAAPTPKARKADYVHYVR